MANTSPAQGRWAVRPVPPEPRSIVELIRAGTLDSELAATIWLLIEAGVPIVVAGEGQGTGKSTLLGALLAFVPPDTTIVELPRRVGDVRLAAAGHGARLGGRRERGPAPGSRGHQARSHRAARERAVGPPAGLHVGRSRAARGSGRLDRLRPRDHDPRRLARGGLRRTATAPSCADRGRAVAPRRRRRPASHRPEPSARGRRPLRPARRARRPRSPAASRAGRARHLGSRG